MLNAYVWTESGFAVIIFISICITSSLNIPTITNCVKVASEKLPRPFKKHQEQMRTEYLTIPKQFY